MTAIPMVSNQAIAAYSSLDDPEWAARLNNSFAAIIESGAWAQEFEMAFGFPPPWTLAEMAAAGA